MLLRSLALIALVTPASAADQPTVDNLKQALEARLQKLRPQGHSERNVIFQEVKVGSSGTAFQVTALVRDYEPGYPPNNYFGNTCIGKFDKEVFRMAKDEFGEWQVQGRLTPPEKECKPNPSAGTSSIPLNALR